MGIGNDISWKRTLRDALLELDPKAFREKVDVARNAINGRLSELQSASDPDRMEMLELTDGLHAVQALGFLAQRSKS